MDLGKAKTVSKRTKHIIHAYTHSIQKLFPFDVNPYYCIPELVELTIILFYYIFEYFTVYGSNLIAIDDNTLEVTEKGYVGSAYGNIQFHKSYEYNKLLWTFQLLHLFDEPLHSLIAFGMDATDKYFANDEFYYAQWDKTKDIGKPFYALQYYGSKTTDLYSEDIIGDTYGKGKPAKIGDIVKMEVNIKEGTIVYYHNEENQGIAFDDVKFEDDLFYYMAIYLEGVGAKIKLIEFEQM